MGNEKNVMIPISLVTQIIELLGYWDISNYDRAIRDDYWGIIQSLEVKMQRLELRDAYAKIIAAKNEDDRHDARMGYLWQKQRLNDLLADGCIF